jgi:hypothetical protein
MKKITKLFALIIILIALVPTAKASHTAGGELIYQWLSDSTYRFFFKYYRDCSGVSEPTTVNLCRTPTPASGFTCPGLSSGTTIMNKWTGTITGGLPNGSALSTGCVGTVTKCTNPSSLIPDYKEWWYSAIMTLPGKCNFWTFSVDAGTRNGNSNLAMSMSMNIEATFNNLMFQGNSSPSFAITPMVYVPNNTPYQYNNAAVDANGDSLSTEVVMPQNTNSACPPTVTGAGLTTGLSIPSAPFPSTAFSVNAVSGTQSFVATTVGTYALATRVSEYKSGGALIGYITREMQFNVLPYTPSAVSATLVLSSLTNCTYNNGVIYNPSNLAMTFCFYIKATVASSILLITGDNSSFVFPGSSVTYTNQGTDSVRGCFSWSPLSSASGTRVFTVIVKDSTCVAGLANYHAFSYFISLDSPISVRNAPAANTVTTIYPNPAQNELNIKSSANYTMAFVINSMGQILHQQKIDPAEKTISIQFLPSGLYYLKLQATEGSTETLKFIKE